MPDSAYKTCKKCRRVKLLSEFHRDKRLKDGHCSDCKACAIARAGEWQRKNPERVAETSRRANRRRPDLLRGRLNRYKERHPEKYKANKAVWDAVRAERLKKPKHCEDCGKPVPKHKLDGHHKDYSKKLEVDWLCRQCHQKRHNDACRTSE